jgi:DNA-binding MarR family transcriptional regulator
MSQKSGAARRPSAQGFTQKQGQYLAFIYTYSRMFRRPPAEADMQRHFQVSPPSVHQMVLTLERAGLIQRQPGVARSIEILVTPEQLPILKWLEINQSNSL